MNFQKIILVGNITADAQKKQSQSGEVTYTRLRVAVANSKGQATFFPITVFGKLAEALTPYLTKGREITVEGRVEVNTNGYFGVIADDIRLGNHPHKTPEPTEANPAEVAEPAPEAPVTG